MIDHYLEYFQWVAYAVAAFSAWQFIPLSVIRLVAAFTTNEQRHKQCMEVLRLAQKDAPNNLPKSPTLSDQ
jgi:hypothetical protein